ncbi:MAG: hypothetical protein ACO1N5_12425 [Noviherbaspirillum sp.]
MARHEAIPRGTLSAAERKKLLIAQGRLYRLGIIESREELAASLSMDNLAKAAVGQLSATGSAVLGQALDKGALAAGASVLWPLLASGASLLVRHRRRLRPSLRGTGALAAAATVAFLAYRWNQVKARR